MRFQFNQEIGHRYQLKERLGQPGAHGQAFRAYDAVRKGFVAVKLYHDDGLDVQTAEAARHFQVAEGSAILPLLEVHPEFPEASTTVMPIAAGTFAESRVFASTAVYVTRRVLTALQFCHGREVVHGDIKPSNIFRDEHDKVMLGDFGVEGCTIEYAAPELIAGANKSVATDLWAVAVTFYQLLCDQLPFGARPDDDDTDIAARITAGDYPNPDELLPYLPLRFRTFFRNALAVDPASRKFGDAGAMRNALTELAVRVEWETLHDEDCPVCFEGHELTQDARRNGTIYRATVTARKRKSDFVPEVKKTVAGQSARRLTGLPKVSGSYKQAGQQLSVWMRHLTESGDYRG